MSDQMRDMETKEKDIDLDSDNADPEGLWFDGRVLWVVDDADDRVYVYDLPGAQPDNTVADGVPGVRTPTSEDVWAATLTVGDGRIFGDGYISSITPIVGSLSPEATFTLDGTTYTVTHLYIGAGALAFGLDKEPPREFTLSVGGEPFVSPGRRDDVAGATYGYIWHDVNLSWSISDTLSVVLSVDYAPKKGGELTADVSGIRDSTDGVAKAFFHYQWFRVDGPDETELDGETGPAYTPTDDDVDKHLKVRVIFDDDAGNKEYPLTSPQVGPVGTNSPATGAPSITGAPRAGGMLTVDLSGITDPEGTDAAEFTYQWIRIDGDSEADIPNATRPTYRPTDEDADKTIKVKVSFTDDEGFPEGPLTSEATATIVAADVLVKNTGQATITGVSSPLSTSSTKRAQAFTTGPNSDGYDLDSIGVRFHDIASTSTAGGELTATLNQQSNTTPGEVVCTLANPASFSSSGIQTFTAPSTGTKCPTLAANTTYFIVIERANNNSHTIALSVTSSFDESVGSANGWSIRNGRNSFSSGAWTSSATQPYMIEVKGSSATLAITSDHRTWVDNRQGVAATGYDNTGAFTIAQGFRTGDTAGIFEVHEIHVEFDRGQPATGKIQVRIVESTAPDDFWEFATPFHFQRGGNYNPQTVTTDGVRTFSRKGGNSALRANTNYFLVIESTNDAAADAAIVRMTGHEGEESEDGWTVDNHSHSKSKEPNSTWTRQDHQVRFRISGSYRQGIGMAGDSYDFESCVELRRGELTNCVAAIAVPEPADPENPPENVSRSGLVLDPDLFPEITKWWTGWWQWMHEYIAFPVTMNPLPTGSDYVTMFVGTRDRTAKSGHDYWGSSESVRFDANSNHTQIVKLRVIDDRVEDSGDYFEFFLFQCRDQNGNHCDHLFVDSSVKGIIYNTEESAEISYLNVSDVTVTEGEGATADFTVSLTAPTTAAVHFDYATEDGTAKDGTDYTGGSGSAFIGNGDTSVTISVDIANDDEWTGDRSFTLKISDAVYASISDDAGTATIRDDDPQALTARFTNLPSSNHKGKPFTFDLRFNQEVSTTQAAMQDDVLTVTKGTLTAAQQVNGRSSHWRITITPDGKADVSVELPATAICSATGAVCTSQEEPLPLTADVSHTFKGPRLSAAIGAPRRHNGTDPFSATLTFSEETDATAEGLKDHAVAADGGTITALSAVQEDSTRTWHMTVQPSGLGHVRLRIKNATGCGEDGQVCSLDQDPLTIVQTVSIHGPVQLSLSDAEATEGGELTFTVTLSNYDLETFQVNYATSDGTATAGEDYTETTGVLRYTGLSTELVITVPVLTDGDDEDAETLTLTLSGGGQHIHLADAKGTGTILNRLHVPNSAPTGLPAITGTPKVGEPLTADTSSIADADGLTSVSYSYQWVRTTDGLDADIAGATSSGYTPDNAAAGTTLKVRVSFQDDLGNAESLTSLPTAEVERTGDGTIWSADMMVVEYSDISIGAATADLFSNIGGSSELQIRSLWSYVPDDDLRLAFVQGVANADDYTLVVGDLTLEFPTGSSGNGNFKWTSVGIDWQDGDTIAVSIVPTSSLAEGVANTAAAGQPTISGTPQVGQELTADTSAITDADGTQTSVFNHQWLADDANIEGATGSSYTLSDAEEGKAIKVRVSFTDDRGNAESLTSAAAAAVAAKPNSPATGAPTITGTPQVGETLTADTSGIADGNGLDNVDHTYQWTADGTDIEGAAGSSFTLTSDQEGDTVQVRVTFTDDDGFSETLTSAATEAVAAANTPPTGLPAISGTHQVGQKLTADTSGISDQDGLSNVSYRYQWIAGGSNIDGATGSSFTPTATQQGQTIQVRVAFTDDGDNQESLTSEATAAVAARPNSPATGLPTINGTAQAGQTLTANKDDIADADGTADAEFSYQWLAGDAEISGATGPTYTLSDDDVGQTIKVRVTFSDDQSNEESLTSAATVAVAAAPNREATGKPTIGGTPQVEQTLTADTSRIADEDGLTNVSYAYQWLAGETDIDGATGSSYELTSSEQGQTIQVRVTFTDDEGFSETLTSVATDAVAAAPAAANNPATGKPTISGTPQVEQTLTADTSSITDADGLTNVAYQYQWLAGGAEIDGAAGSSFTLTAAQQGKTIQVRVDFEDDLGNSESLTSAATEAVAAKPIPLTATFENVPEAHSGAGTEFTFRLRFSESFKLSYTVLRDHAFQVDGGKVTKAKRVNGRDDLREIHIKPDGNGPVTITLPETTDCDDDGAICTEDGRKLSNRNEFTASGPDG